MDKFSGLEKYSPEPLYNSDQKVDSQELLDIDDWDNPYNSKNGALMSTGEMAKTIEMMEVLKNEVERRSEDMDDLTAGLSRFKKIESPHHILGTVVTAFISEDKPAYSIQLFKNGQEDGKVRVSLIEKDGNEAGLVIQKDGNFQLTIEKRMGDGQFRTFAYSTLPRDTKIGFTRMNPEATKTSVMLINRFLRNDLRPHQPGTPSQN